MSHTPNEIKSETVLNDSEILKILRNFLLSEKPPETTPVDTALVSLLIVFKAIDHDVYHSQQTLARMLGCDVKTIVRCQKRLASPKLDWLARPRRKGRSSSLCLKFENVPSSDPNGIQVTQDAKNLSVRYQLGLKKLGRKRFPKHWLKSQFFSAQNILNRCDGDLELAARMIGHAIAHGRHKKSATESLYNLLGRWKHVERTFSEMLQEQEAKRVKGEEQARLATNEMQKGNDGVADKNKPRINQEMEAA